ncbi:hypothetical protein [Thermus sediminis]|uniref:hypothetical protein n=1 Tax=Thermus sediminis TaxID=1761908 RepID=UPI000E3DD47A|nr:hypothetical protein [Thermus sediminis]
MRALLPLSAALALFLLLFAAFRFSGLGGALAFLAAGLLYLGVARWQGQALSRRPSRAALERLAMKEAWRRGGYLLPAHLAPFLPEGEAKDLLEALAARGLCRREGEGYRF